MDERVTPLLLGATRVVSKPIDIDKIPLPYSAVNAPSKRPGPQPRGLEGCLPPAVAMFVSATPQAAC